MSGVEVLHDMPEAAYHASPALSASGAKRIIQTCPAVFRHEQVHGRPHKAVFDFGHAAHTLILGAGEPVDVIDADDYRSARARQERDDAYQAGHTPVLAHEWAQVQAMAAAIREHPTAARLLNPDNGTPEQSIFWRDDTFGVDRRARLDWCTTIGSLPVVVDLKTTTTADPRVLGRRIADFGYHQQVAYYLDAVHEAGIGDDPAFVFVFQEKQAPYLVSVVDIDDRAVALGRELNTRALEVFRDCTATGVWPAYLPGDGVTTVTLPRWAYNDSEVMM